MAVNLFRRSVICAALVLLPLLGGAHSHAADQTVRVGIMSAEEEDIWSVVSQEALKRGLTVKLSVFNDYTQPNGALENGELVANAFQHKPYLDNQIKARGYHIVPAGYAAVWPIGLYSRKHHKVADLPNGAVIGVPNDPSNEGRALRVLESQGLIKLKSEAGILATTQDITANPRNIVVKELDAGIVGRSIDDLDAAVVNTDWALKSNLTQGDRLAIEPVENNPYRNFIAVKAGHENDPWAKILVASYENDTVRAALARIYKGTARPAW
jgi:D-methionine transport system substrate-binding protein